MRIAERGKESSAKTNSNNSISHHRKIIRNEANAKCSFVTLVFNTICATISEGRYRSPLPIQSAYSINEISAKLCIDRNFIVSIAERIRQYRSYGKVKSRFKSTSDDNVLFLFFVNDPSARRFYPASIMNTS